MASVKLYLDTRKARKDGTFPLKLSVTHKNSFLIGLDVFLTKQQWDGTHINITDDAAKQKRLSLYARRRLEQATQVIYDLKILGRLSTTSDKQLRALIESNDLNQPEDPPLLFKDHYDAYTKNITARSTLDTYNNMLVKVAAFANIQTLTFEQMNYAWMKDFEIFMKSERLATNTRGIYFRNIRTVFNDAIDREIIPMGLYPFRRFKIAREKTMKRSLTVDQLRTLRDYDCELSQEQYRDIFMLIFYFCGINLIDLCNLTQIENGYIIYSRAKTGRPYKIKVEDEAMEIIEKYRGKKYLLNILDRYADHKNYMHRLNKNLKEIGITEIVKDKAGKLRKKQKTGLFPALSSYWARHTWATIAAELDIPKETIAAALGHSDNSVTDIYINFDQKKIDLANRKVLDYLLTVDSRHK